MNHWNLAACDPAKNDGASWFLRNRSSTQVSVSKRTHFDPVKFFQRLDKIKFPLKYSEGLERISFTVLTGDAGGYYMDNRIWVDISQNQIDHVVEIFTHEIGHHVEEQEAISTFLHEERMKKAKHLHSKFSEKSDDEYMAIGFEKYYTEDPATRRELRKKNPLLYKTIQYLHREYHLKG
jgi:hypothetical protein